MQTRSADDLVDLRDGALAAPDAGWRTVEVAAAAASVHPETVRSWCGAGLVPLHADADGELVPVDAVRALAEAIDLNVSYWAAETEAARAELAVARRELAEALESERETQELCDDLEDENAVLRASLEGQTFAIVRRADGDVPEADVAVESEPEPVVVRPAPGDHIDDYLPQLERHRRRGRR